MRDFSVPGPRKGKQQRGKNQITPLFFQSSTKELYNCPILDFMELMKFYAPQLSWFIHATALAMKIPTDMEEG